MTRQRSWIEKSSTIRAHRKLARAATALGLIGVTLSLWSCEVDVPPESADQAAIRPNVILIVLDDVHYDDFGAYGNTYIRTPNIDRLAAEGLRFTQYYANAPICSPTRAALLTGLYPHRFNLRSAVTRGAAGSNLGLPGDATTLAEILGDAGYTTAHVGKWHLGGGRPEYRPTHQGFDHSLTLVGDAADYPKERPSSTAEPHRDGFFLIDETVPRYVPGYDSEVMTDYALAFVRENQDVPFFLNLWYFEPHLPLNPPAEWARAYADNETGLFAASVSHIDHQIGRVLDALAEMGLDERTLVFVTSDNGGIGSVITHRQSSLRGFKGTLYEGGIRVPLIARWRGTIAPGAADDRLLASMDLLPTVAELSEIDLSDLPLDGSSFKDALLGRADSTTERTLFFEAFPGNSPREEFAVRRGPWKLVADGGTYFLFNLLQSPKETGNLVRSHPDVVVELVDEYREWRLDTRELLVPVDSTEGSAEFRAGERGTLDRAVLSPPGGRIALGASALHDVGAGDLSLSFWFRRAPGEPERRVLLEKQGSWRLEIGADDRLSLSLQSEVGRELTVSSPARLAFDLWHHVVVTMGGGSREDSKVRLFVDGRLHAQRQGPRRVAESAEPITLGGGSQDGTSFLGEFEDLRTWAYRLNLEEAGRLYRQGLFRNLMRSPATASAGPRQGPAEESRSSS